jgi:tRNA pseudouridine38-40 synthase
MPRYLLTIEFDGTSYSGWQIQPDAETVEGVIEEAFSKILQEPIDLIGQGRTDAGVHARAQTAHVDLPEKVDLYKVIHGVNSLAGEAIYIKEYVKVKEDFHARFNATHRCYSYRLSRNPSPLIRKTSWYPGEISNYERLNECASLLDGTFDFKGFSKYNEENYTTICTVFEANWERTEENLIFTICANRFLRNMVRRLVGTMVAVSQEQYTLEDFEKLLIGEAMQKGSKTAPPSGLILEKVFYDF